MNISKNTKLKDVLKEPCFAEYKQYLLPWKKGIILQLKMKHLQHVWNMGPIIEGLNYMKELQEKSERIFYPVYDKEKVKEDESLKEQIIFHFPIEKKSEPIIICAGGGYGMVCSFVEAFPVARQLNKMGYHAFVVNYRVGEDARYPNPMDDLANAVKYIIDNAENFNIDTGRYAVMGFSAGGHLCASFGTESLGYRKYNLPKPAALMLVYPVITMEKYTHLGSRHNLLGRESDNDMELLDKFSIEKLVTSEYPPCYIWQCDRDSSVPIENTKMLAHELENAKIPYRYDVFEGRAHGWGIAEGTTAKDWLKLAVEFYESLKN